MSIRVVQWVDGGYGYGQCALHSLQSKLGLNTIDGFLQIYVYSIFSLQSTLLY